MSLNKGVVGLLVSLALVSIAISMLGRVPAMAQDADTNSAKIRSLMEERRDVLQRRLEATEYLVQNSSLDPMDVIEARRDLLDAELAMATNKAQRVDVLQRTLANAKQLEAVMKQRLQIGRGRQTDLLLANARRLDVEIALLHEQD